MLENGFVLLTSDTFDYQQLVSDLQTQWQITAQDAQPKDSSFVFSVSDFMCALSVMPAPIPNDEAVQRAQGNYYNTDAVEIAKAHQAHLMVTLMNQAESTEIAGMTLYSKIVSSCLTQDNATGVYTSGTVFSADFYRQVCNTTLQAGDIPVMVWVFIGMGQTENGNQLYTSGMAKFNKEDMEILNSKLDMQPLHQSLLSMCGYIITSNLTLQDGESIGFSAEQKWQISRSKSVYAPSEYSLKVDIS